LRVELFGLVVFFVAGFVATFDTLGFCDLVPFDTVPFLTLLFFTLAFFGNYILDSHATPHGSRRKQEG
jgi:hypothetical protein